MKICFENVLRYVLNFIDDIDDFLYKSTRIHQGYLRLILPKINTLKSATVSLQFFTWCLPLSVRPGTPTYPSLTAGPEALVSNPHPTPPPSLACTSHLCPPS